jgi:hypothetical protein
MSKIAAIAFAALTMFGVACSEDPITTIDRSTDCADICDKYKECVQSNFDTDGCTKQCRGMTTDEDTKKIDDCQDCISGANSCVDKAWKCTSQCAGIIVDSAN